MRSLTYTIVLRPVLTYFLVSVAMLLPLVAQGQGLVPECGADCGWEHLVGMINGVITWLIMIATSVAVLLFTYAGFLYLTSRGDESQVKQATTIFTNVAIGFGIMLIAWLLVATIVSILTGNDISLYI